MLSPTTAAGPGRSVVEREPAMNRNFALIIGVHDYRTYDPTGASNVPGALHDARALTRECLAMGFSPERIRVLTSPPLPPGELGPVTTGEATRAGIEEGLLWLAGALGDAAPTSGLLTFSGHGAEGTAGMPLLCPSDTTKSLEEAIDVGALREMAPPEVRRRLTALLDCCHAQVGPSAAEGLQARLRARASGAVAPAEAEEARARVIAACRWDQESVSARFVGQEMGAFTWAITSAMGQWSPVVEDGVARLRVSYGDLVARARELLSSLSFEQDATLSGPEGVAALPFLDPWTEAGREETSRTPTAKRDGRQLDGGQLTGTYAEYSILLCPKSGITSYLAYMYVTAPDMGTTPPTIGGSSMRPSTEYWVFTDSVVPSLATCSKLNVYANGTGLTADVTVDTTTQTVYTAGEQVGWTKVASDVVKFWTTIMTQNVRGLSLEVSDTAVQSVQWFQNGQKNLTQSDLDGRIFYREATALYTASSQLVAQ